MNRQNKLLIVLGGAVLLYLLARSDKGSTFVTDILTSAARGIRNNNPGNIRLSSTVWAGQVPPSSQTDTSFVQFTRPEYGIRAMAKIFNSYIARGVDTIEKIVAVYAPASENNTGAYSSSVSSETGIDPHAKVSAADYPKLIPAFIRHENGSQPYPLDLIHKGISLA